VKPPDEGVVGIPDAEVGRQRAGHLGLTAMRERAELAGGWCNISRMNQGTAVEAWVPADEARAGG
jgi:signal transduction histidine kinase